MTVAVVLVTLTAVGAVAVRALDPDAPPLRAAGEAMLLGLGLGALVPLALSLFGFAWSGPAIATGMAFLAVGLGIAARRRGASVVEAPAEPGERLEGSRGSRIAALCADLATALAFVSYAAYATLAAPWEWDYWAIWGLKAKQFFFARGIDWEFLAEPYNSFLHPDYPPLVSMIFDLFAQAQGAWDDRWYGMVYPFLALATLLFLRSILREQVSPLFAALGTAACTSAVLVQWIGMAELHVVAFASCGALLVRNGLRGQSSAWNSAALLLGFAALSKNEGFAFLVAVTIAVAVVPSGNGRLHALIRLWPAWVLGGGWQLLRVIRGLRTDLFEGTLADRSASRLENLGEVTRALASNLPSQPLVWILAIAAIAISYSVLRRTERFLLIAVCVQILFLFGSYLATPHDIEWHVASSWVRIVSQMLVLILALAFLGLGRWVAAAEPVTQPVVR